MYVPNEHEEGMAAVAGEAMKSGHIVTWSIKSDLALHAMKVTDSSQAGKRVGLAYTEFSKTQATKFIAGRRNSAPMAPEVIDSGDALTIIQGRFRCMNNQLADGTYYPGDELTVDWANAIFKKAGNGDVVYARVQANAQPTTVTSQDNLVPISGSFPEAL